MRRRHNEPDKQAPMSARWKARGFRQEIYPGLRLSGAVAPSIARRDHLPVDLPVSPSDHCDPKLSIFLGISAHKARIRRVLIAVYNRSRSVLNSAWNCSWVP